jgi:serine/threonine protein phosphatase PrpC
MRRENSKFNTAFISYEGAKLFNNDYFGFAELDGFACYAIADGIESGDTDSHSAEIAVQAVIAAFHEHASVKPWALRRYMRAAHTALKKSGAHLSLRASVMIVVTDYRVARYAWAGNARFYLYRAGRLFSESRDHSLSRRLADKGKLPLDKIALHEERGNLSRYAGQPGTLRPQISKKLKLKDGDSAVLLTRGLWENCDAGDIKAALDGAENDPQKAVDGLELLLLNRSPEDADNFTAASVFIDKIYTDPDRGKKIKRVLAVAVPILAVAAALSIVLLIRHNKNETKRRNMQTAFLNAVEYIEDENYIRAGEEITSAVSLAKDLNDQVFSEKADNYRKLTEAVISGDTLLAAGAFEDAQASYLAAKDRSRFTDNAGRAYIDRKLTAVGGFISVRDIIALGDILAASGDYGGAEEKYMSARQLASGISDADGRKQAIDALESLYVQKDRDQSQAQDAAQQRDETLREASDMEASGDEAASNGDLTGARLRYIIASERFAALEDAEAQSRISIKLESITEIEARNDEQAAAAARYVGEGDILYDEGDYIEAKVKYILARNIYSRIRDDVSLADILSKIEVCDSRINSQSSSVAAAAINSDDNGSNAERNGDALDTQPKDPAATEDEGSESANTQTLPAESSGSGEKSTDGNANETGGAVG